MLCGIVQELVSKVVSSVEEVYKIEGEKESEEEEEEDEKPNLDFRRKSCDRNMSKFEDEDSLATKCLVLRDKMEALLVTLAEESASSQGSNVEVNVAGGGTGGAGGGAGAGGGDGGDVDFIADSGEGYNVDKVGDEGVGKVTKGGDVKANDGKNVGRGSVGGVSCVGSLGSFGGDEDSCKTFTAEITKCSESYKEIPAVNINSPPASDKPSDSQCSKPYRKSQPKEKKAVSLFCPIDLELSSLLVCF